MARIKTFFSEFKPWNRELPWYWVGLEGAIALAVGIYFVAAPDAANSTIRLLLAALLIASSVFDILTGFRNYGNRLVELPMTPFLLLRGGGGVTLGLFFFLATRSEYVTDNDARYILGFGLISYALIGLAGVIVAMIKGRMHWMAIGSNLLFLMLGGVLVYNRRETVSAETAVRYLGWAAVVGGVILLLYTYFLRQGQESEGVFGPAEPVAFGARAAGGGLAGTGVGTIGADLDPVTSMPSGISPKVPPDND